MYALIGITLLILVFSAIQFQLHRRRILSIPIRIYVNGTRGKSSVTRLIAAGLRSSGIKTIAKTTGTLPRIILEDSSEIPIIRLAGATIREQLKVIKYAAKRKPKAVVLECMAVQPKLQWISEQQMLYSTIGVITNARPDHLDVMGPTVFDVTLSLCNTIPKKGILYTSEKKMFPIMQKAGDKVGARVITVDDNTVTDEELRNFSYLEHKENVALALAVCEKAGAVRDKALEGMWSVVPDPGALRIHKTTHMRKEVKFVNGFAANDPESTYAIWEKLLSEGYVEGDKIIMLNTREDRFFRGIQLCEMILEKKMEFDHLLLVGGRTDDLVHFLKEHKISEKISVKDWGTHTRFTPEKIYSETFHLFEKQATVYAIGNIGGEGREITQYFYGRKIPKV